MKQLLTMIKLEFALKFPRIDKGKRLFVRILDGIAILLGLFLIGALILFVFYSLLSLCIKGDLVQEFLVFFIFLIQVLQLLFGLSLLTKTLYFSSDSASLLKLPVSGEKIFLAKIFFAYFYITMISSVIMLPVLIMFGILTGQALLFYFMIPLICVFCPLLPFILSTLFALPTMYIISFLKNKFILMLSTYVVLVAGGFITYMNILGVLIKLLDTSSNTALLTSEAISSVKDFAFYFFPEVLLKNILVNVNFIKSLAVYVLGGALLMILIVLLAKKMYVRVLLNNVESENTYMTKKVKIKQTSVAAALFEKEFINIFRSINYSFQYLAVILTTPLMVYFSNAIASQIGAEKLGSGILPGISLLVLIMFLSMGVSFSATSITREGDKFFHTKIIPVKYSKQIAVKVCLYVIVAIPCIFLSCFVLYFFNFLSLLETLLYSISISFIILGNICYGIEKDIKNPKFKYVGNQEYTGANRNVISSVGIGLIISMVMGIVAILFSFFLSLDFIYYVLFGFAIPYALAEVLILFIKVDRKYQNIEA
jgi:ABC-2 type transport system permease protein